jgi:DNA ligase (NAD+)
MKIKKKDLGKKYSIISLSAFVAAFLEGVSSTIIEEAISAGFDTLEKLKDANIRDIVKKAKLKENQATAIKYGIIEHENEMKEYISSGKVKIEMPGLVDAKLKGVSFCFTGSLESMDRTAAKEKIRILGGITRNGITKELSFLVTNDKYSGSTKSIMAEEYKIPVINEKEFYDILETPDRVEYYGKRGNNK